MTKRNPYFKRVNKRYTRQQRRIRMRHRIMLRRGMFLAAALLLTALLLFALDRIVFGELYLP